MANNKNEIRITISGVTGSGKTTIAMLIAKTLQGHGFKVTENDVDVCSYNHHPDFLDARLDALFEHTNVTIDTVQKEK